MNTETRWYLKPMTIDSLTDLMITVKMAHEQGQGLCCCTMNQIRIALKEYLAILIDKQNNTNN